jgi:hypothetical protein
MSNQILSAVSLDDQAGICANFSQMKVIGVVLKSAPAGTLTMTGVTQSSGLSQTWTTSSAGWSAAPGSGLAWGGLSFSYSNAADKGLAIAIVQPL